MKNKCKTCGREYRIEPPFIDGQEIVCPYCGEIGVYRIPTRIEVPVGARRTPAHETQPEARPETPCDTKPEMQPVSRFHVIRPTDGAGHAASSGQDNELVGSVRRRSRAVARRELLRKIKIVVKDLFWLLVLVGLVLGGWRLFRAWQASRPTAVQSQQQADLIKPSAIADLEARQLGVRAAVVLLTKDLHAAEERISAARTRAERERLSKFAEIALILDDVELNELAQLYLGEDWCAREGSFCRLMLRQKLSDGNRELLEKRVRDLEEKRKMLSRRLHCRYRDVHRETRQRTVNCELMQAVGKGTEAGQSSDEKDHLEQVKRFEESTSGALVECISGRLREMRCEENKLEDLCALASVFDAWPFNSFHRSSKESEHEERL